MMAQANKDSQLKTLEKIIAIVAKYMPVNRVTHMVRLNKKVRKCMNKEKKIIKQYINRLKESALEYLKLTRSGQDSSESRVFAINWY